MSSTIILSDNGASSGSAGLKSQGGNDGVLILQTTTSGGTATNALTIDTSQNVGIGTSSPNAKVTIGTPNPQSVPTMLSVGGATQTVASGTGQLGIYGTDAAAADKGGTVSFTANTTSLNGYAMASISGKYQTAGAGVYGGYLQFCTTDSGGTVAERMRIDSSGNLLVGTTDASATTGPGFKVLSSGTAPAIVATYQTNANSSFLMYSTGAAAYRFYVDWSGQIHAANGAIGGVSDVSLKENIRDIDTGLNTVLALKPRRFDWKNGDGKDVAGFIAQEVESVMPDLVIEAMYSENETKKSLLMGQMVPTLVKAIQELKADLDATKAELAALKGQA